MLSLKAKKRELTQVVIGDDARALEGLTEEDVRALLGSARSIKRSTTRTTRTRRAEALADRRARDGDEGERPGLRRARRRSAVVARVDGELAERARVNGSRHPIAHREVAGERQPFPCYTGASREIRGDLGRRRPASEAAADPDPAPSDADAHALSVVRSLHEVDPEVAARSTGEPGVGRDAVDAGARDEPIGG